jgi:hypothetical protein
VGSWHQAIHPGGTSRGGAAAAVLRMGP